jgi:hypothetical protein
MKKCRAFFIPRTLRLTHGAFYLFYKIIKNHKLYQTMTDQQLINCIKTRTKFSENFPKNISNEEFESMTKNIAIRLNDMTKEGKIKTEFKLPDGTITNQYPIPDSGAILVSIKHHPNNM